MDSTPSPTITAPRPYPLPRGTVRWALGSLYVLGTGLQVVEFALENPRDDTVERVAYWTENVTRVGWAMAAGILAVPFLLGGFAVLVQLCRGASSRLAWSAGVFLTMAMVGLSGLHGLELAAYGLVRNGDTAAAVSVLDGDDVWVPGGVLIVLFLVGALLGVLALIAATWRSPLLPRIVPVAILGFAVFDFVLGYGLVGHLIGLVAALAVAWSVAVEYDRSGQHQPRVRLPRPRARREVGAGGVSAQR